MYWVGKTSDRVGRGGSNPPPCETRWIVPVRPYQAPRGSWERAENAILMGVAVAVIVFSFACIIVASL
jgi:hypothetical protein